MTNTSNPQIDRSTNVDASTVEKWAAEWRGSAALQADYPTVGAYVATNKRAARVASAIVTPSALLPRSMVGTDAEAWASAWNASADLHSEYPTVEAYVAMMRRV